MGPSLVQIGGSNFSILWGVAVCACLMNIFVLALGEIAPAQRWTPCFWFFVYFEFYFALKKCHHFCKLLIDFSVMPPGTLLQTLVAKIRTFLESWIADPKGIAKVLYFLLALWAKVWFSFNSIGHGASILIGKSTTSSKAIFFDLRRWITQCTFFAKIQVFGKNSFLRNFGIFC